VKTSEHTKATKHPTKTRPESILVRLMRVFAFVMVLAHESLALAVEFAAERIRLTCFETSNCWQKKKTYDLCFNAMSKEPVPDVFTIPRPERFLVVFSLRSFRSYWSNSANFSRTTLAIDGSLPSHRCR